MNIASNTSYQKTNRFNRAMKNATDGQQGLYQFEIARILSEFVLHLNPTNEQLKMLEDRLNQQKTNP